MKSERVLDLGSIVRVRLSVNVRSGEQGIVETNDTAELGVWVSFLGGGQCFFLRHELEVLA